MALIPDPLLSRLSISSTIFLWNEAFEAKAHLRKSGERNGLRCFTSVGLLMTQSLFRDDFWPKILCRNLKEVRQIGKSLNKIADR